MDNLYKIAAIVVAGGNGSRMGIQKQYLPLCGSSIIGHSIAVISKFADITVIASSCCNDVALQGLSGNAHIIQGGVSRQKSVLNGLKYLAQYNPQHVLIHDAARPNASARLISKICDILQERSAVVPCLSVFDSVKRIKDDIVQATIDRNEIRLAQTPQGFHFNVIYNLHLAAQKDGFSANDDSEICMHYGIQVHTMPGEYNNFKITTYDDYLRCRDKS